MCECPGCYKGVGCVECGLCRREKDDGVQEIPERKRMSSLSACLLRVFKSA